MIRVISIGLFRRDGRLLVAEGTDPVGGKCFARPLGGGVERGETSAAALVREIREELGQEITDLRLLGVLENIFHYNGATGHEIVFVYDAVFVDQSLYALASLPIRETGWPSPAVWRSLDSFDDNCRLVPDGLAALMCRHDREMSKS